MSLAVDSAKPLLNEVVSSLRRIEEILSFVGIFYVGKLTLPTLWEILKGLRTHLISKLMPLRMVERYGKWAVVTGSTEGIGKAYAFELARNGMNIVLIAPTMTELDKVSHEISNEYGVETEIVQADFREGRSIYDLISKSILQKDIGVLVNSIGIQTPHPAPLGNLSEDDLWSMVNADIGAAPAMTKLVLPGMVDRKRGVIINISGFGGYSVPLPYRQIYTACKAFVMSYSKALEYEYRSSGIIVQTVLPGLIADATERVFQPYVLAPSASNYAYQSLSTLGHSSCTSGYWAHGLMSWLFQKIPESILMWSYAFAFNHCTHLDKKKKDT